MIKEIKYNNGIGGETTNEKIPHGTIFAAKIGAYPDNLFIKLQEVIYSLNDLQQGHHWSAPGCPVKDYKPVDIEITVL